MGMMGRAKTRASLQGDYDTLLGMRQALDEMEIETDQMICSHSLKAIGNSETQIRFFSREKERIALLKSLQGQWCLGSDEMAMFCGENNFFILISAPFNSRYQYAAHLPFMGEKGMDYLLELKSEFADKFGE